MLKYFYNFETDSKIDTSLKDLEKSVLIFNYCVKYYICLVFALLTSPQLALCYLLSNYFILCLL